MANDFVLVRCNLVRSAEVMTMAMGLGIPPAHVVGCLAVVWGWARDEMQDDGSVRVQPALLDGLVGIDGFADAMQSAGWLDTTADGVSFPEPDKWITRDAVKKARDADRKRRVREVSAKCPQSVRDVSAKSRTKTRLEEDREEERDREEEYYATCGGVIHADAASEPDLSPDLRGMVSKRLAALAGISPSQVPGTLVGELVAYTAGRASRKHDAASWPSEASAPLDRARMLSEAFDVAEAEAQTRTPHGLTGFVVSVMESAITAGEYPSEKKHAKRKPRRKCDEWRDALDDAMDWSKESA